MSNPKLVLVCGLPGSGKTTIARQLEKELPAVRLCPDESLHDLGFSYTDGSARDKIEAQQWKLGQELLKHGQNVILENGFWTRSDRDKYRIGARTLNVGVELQYLDVPIDELWQRLELRNQTADPGTPVVNHEDLQTWADSFEVPTPEEQALFD